MGQKLEMSGFDDDWFTELPGETRRRVRFWSRLRTCGSEKGLADERERFGGLRAVV